MVPLSTKYCLSLFVYQLANLIAINKLLTQLRCKDQQVQLVMLKSFSAFLVLFASCLSVKYEVSLVSVNKMSLGSANVGIYRLSSSPVLVQRRQIWNFLSLGSLLGACLQGMVLVSLARQESGQGGCEVYGEELPT
ncbi:hypothetical protein L596_020601 [Steinernema carpocapsae]|uniref:Uncharacterized protein n=1 Tax=Steinernema carpocapsae TaxID=34508 RepID=A0A4U5MU75_STECR|nr:hypothetical protein L596_020601 [Steinernema carpocapsae]